MHRRRLFVVSLSAFTFLVAGAVFWQLRHHGGEKPRSQSVGSTTATSAPGGTITGALHQMISPGHLRSLVSAGLSPTIAGYFFNTPSALFNVGANGKLVKTSAVTSVHQTYPNASVGWLFNSFGPNTLTGASGIQGVLSGGSIPAGLAYIQYDPEGPGNGTPTAETSALETGNTSYVAQAGALAHAHGLKFFFTPSIDAGMTSEESKFPAKYNTWLSQGRGKWAAIPGVDLYSIQSQQAEATPSFSTFVAAALAQARAADPRTPVDIGIGINPSNPPTAITASDLMNAYMLGRTDGAAGYWHNVEKAGAGVPDSTYVAFFQQLYTQLHG